MKVLNVAKYIVYLSYHRIEASLTPLKLQKILYFCQGWSYVWDNKPLFKSKFEAWQYGPVNRIVYDYFKEYRAGEIPESEGRIPQNVDDDTLETIRVVWENYHKYDAFELVEITHNEGPWEEAYSLSKNISNNEIKNYFQSKYA